jgi:hypothetical protein
VTLIKHKADLHPYQRRQSRLHASCFGWLRGRVCFCNIYIATSVQFSSLGFLISQASDRYAALLQQPPTVQGGKRKNRQKYGKGRKPFLNDFNLHNTRAENWGFGCEPFLRFADFGGSSPNEIKALLLTPPSDDVELRKLRPFGVLGVWKRSA